MGGGVKWQIYPKSANFELTCCFMLCFTEGLFVLHTKDLITKDMHGKFSDVFFSGKGCFKGTFSLQIKKGAKIYTKPYPGTQCTCSRSHFKKWTAYRKNKQMCNWELTKHLSGATLFLALIRPVHRSPTVNDIFLKLTNTCYLILIAASSRYLNLKLDKK